MELGWLSVAAAESNAYELSDKGTLALAAIGIDVEATRTLRRRFAFACVDWSERRPHLGGAFGAALLKVARQRNWGVQELDCRALSITRVGQREMLARFGLQVEASA